MYGVFVVTVTVLDTLVRAGEIWLVLKGPEYFPFLTSRNKTATVWFTYTSPVILVP